MSATDERINPETERKHMESDLDAMLVCAYDDKRSSSKTVQGEVSLDDFESRAGALRKDREIIF